MPHGSGHHGGGGGFHGGGFGGGHHHHHHHHFGHRHHYNYGGGGWGWYGHGYGRGGIIYRRPWSVFWTVLVIVIIVVVLTSSLSIHSSNSSAHSGHGNIHASRDTSVLGYNNKFCDRLHIDGSGFSAEEVQLTLYLLQSPPTNTKQEQIAFSQTLSLYREYHYWFFHLLPGSRININACTYSGSLGSTTFYFIKSIRNFERWDDDGSRYYEKIQTVYDCNGDNGDGFFTYEVRNDDRYYMAFENEYGSSSLHLKFNISQVLYTVSPDIVKDNCSIRLDSYKSCSLPVPYSSNFSKVLLQLEPRPGSVINWDASNDVPVKCHARGWLYAVICLSSVAGVILLVVGVAITCLVIYRHKKGKQSSAINTTSTSTHVATGTNGATTPTLVAPSAPTKDSAPLILPTQPPNENPPPYNYSTLPPYKP